MGTTNVHRIDLALKMGTTNVHRIDLALKIWSCDVISLMHCLNSLKIVAESSRHLQNNQHLLTFS